MNKTSVTNRDITQRTEINRSAPDHNANSPHNPTVNQTTTYTAISLPTRPAYSGPTAGQFVLQGG